VKICPAVYSKIIGLQGDSLKEGEVTPVEVYFIATSGLTEIAGLDKDGRLRRVGYCRTGKRAVDS